MDMHRQLAIEQEYPVTEHKRNKVNVITQEAADKLRIYLPLRLIPFWDGLHILIKTDLCRQAECKEHFFTLVEAEYARFNKEGLHYNWKSSMWETRAQRELDIKEFYTTYELK